MTSPFWKHARLPRHNAAEESSTRIEVVRPVAQQADPIRAELRDVSRDGLQLVVNCDFADQEPVIVRMVQPGTDLDLQIAATVCWVRQEGEEDWSVGCRFAQRLDWEEYGELFMNGILEAE